MKDYRLYILMRTDLQSMGPGRACAQASHATNAFMKEWGNRIDVKEWQKQTNQGFGTAIVLGVTNEQIEKVLKSRVIPSGKIIDPDYCIRVTPEVASLMNIQKEPFLGGMSFNYDDPSTVVISRKEMTCAYVFGEKEELEPLLGELPLYE